MASISAQIISCMFSFIWTLGCALRFAKAANNTLEDPEHGVWISTNSSRSLRKSDNNLDGIELANLETQFWTLQGHLWVSKAMESEKVEMFLRI